MIVRRYNTAVYDDAGRGKELLYIIIIIPCVNNIYTICQYMDRLTSSLYNNIIVIVVMNDNNILCLL